ncbi:MAG: hypothetical protein ABI906_06655 [Pseudomonadota bacterium]
MDEKKPEHKPLRNRRREAFALAMARGAAPLEACVAAGYKRCSTQAGRIKKLAEVVEREEQLREELAWGGSGDLAPVINEMRRLAVAAGELGTAAGMMAAKGFLVEAARLKGMLPVELAPLPRRLTNEEWLAKHKPKP